MLEQNYYLQPNPGKLTQNLPIPIAQLHCTNQWVAFHLGIRHEHIGYPRVNPKTRAKTLQVDKTKKNGVKYSNKNLG